MSIRVRSVSKMPKITCLRQLRLWHWRKAMLLRHLAKTTNKHPIKSKQYDEEANNHIRAVQHLNDIIYSAPQNAHFPTAEEDNRDWEAENNI